MASYNKKFHCYFAPFYVDERQKMHILMGKKVLYSDQQGFFMNNAKQWVFLGGNCGLFSNKNEIINVRDKKYKKTLQRAIKEFVEETGLDFITINDIDSDKIFNYTSSTQPFEVFFFKVDINDIDNMTKINREKAEIYFYEIDEIKWIPFEIALYLSDESIKAQNYNVGIDDTLSYLKDLRERKDYWRLDDMFLRPSFQKYTRDRRNFIPKNYIGREDALLDLYVKYGNEVDRELVYFFKDFIQFMIYKKLSTDWFFEALEYLKGEVERGAIKAQISTIKNTGLSGQENPIIRKLLYEQPGQIKIPTSFQSMIDSVNERRHKVGWTYAQKQPQQSRFYNSTLSSASNLRPQQQQRRRFEKF